MTDRQYRREVRRIRRFAMRWITCLGLRWWRIELHFTRDARLERDGAWMKQNLAETSVLWQYMRADLQFHVAECRGLSAGDLEAMVVHELCHVLVAEMREWAGAGDTSAGALLHEERVVSCLCNAFVWTHAEGRKKRRR